VYQYKDPVYGRVLYQYSSNSTNAPYAWSFIGATGGGCSSGGPTYQLTLANAQSRFTSGCQSADINWLSFVGAKYNLVNQ
jgi:hypothetical protein